VELITSSSCNYSKSKLQNQEKLAYMPLFSLKRFNKGLW